MVTSSGSIRRSDPGYAFDFCGGQIAIDFTNTVGSRGGTPEEHLRTGGDVIAWAEARGLLRRADAGRLRRRAARQPAAARAAMAEALVLREALYRVIAAAAAGRQSSDADLAIVNGHLCDALARLRLTPQRGSFELLAPGDDDALGAPIVGSVVRAAADLLTSDAINRVRACADPGCAWLFLDVTRNGTRRWCTMQSCGNRAKARRFRMTREQGAPIPDP